jgi:acyl-CoA synthetase (AMP-forming)/AMP-acid ligase II
MSTSPATLTSLLAAGADEATALSVPGATTPLAYRALRDRVQRVCDRLGAAGVRRGDRVAMVLEGGPEAALCFLGVAACCAAAPLNPAYRDEELEFYLGDLAAKLLIVQAGTASPAARVAERLSIPVLELSPTPEAGVGTFVLGDPAAAGPSLRGHRDPRAEGERAEGGDDALVLHTSGTTSRPKMVPLTQRNLCTSAANVAATLALTPGDRGLVVMPLFHIHGLIAGLLAPLSAGGEVCCTTGFNALSFFRWYAQARPTWYTAVPTMHQAVLARAGQHRDIIQAHPLRFIRSSSAALPPQVIAELERVFGAPVVESYGMTEASHQMASNPLPPGVRKVGTVGPAAGPEVAIMDPTGALLPAGARGEIVIRGATITRGYEHNPKANGEAFISGWFRTGDQGVMDADGYVTITGRLKEIINRGGEKISPREVDEVLLDHPDVAQAVTFAVPHEMLGEEVGAAVVLRGGASTTDKELRAFCSSRLAAFKVPRTVVFLSELPKGPTGKLQRIGLAERLGLGPKAKS